MPKLFYGWYVVASVFLIAVWGWGLGFYGPSVYLAALQQRHGWSAATISGAITAYYLIGAGMVALLGGAVRRFGPIAPVLTGITAMGMAVTALPMIDRPWQLYVVFAVMAVGWAAMSSAMVNILVAPWFERQRGLALSLAMNGASLGGVIVAPAMLALIRLLGFQLGVLVAVLTMLAMLVPVVVIVLRRQPGALEDGQHRNRPSVPRPRSRDSGEPRVPRPLTTLAYWTISIPFSLGLAAQVGFLIHEVAFLTPIVGSASAGIALSVTTASAIAGRLLMGTVVDRVEARHAAALNFLVEITGLALLIWRPFDGAIYLGCAVVGLAVGNMTSLPGLLVQREFPSEQFAMVVSLVVATNQVVYSFAPAIVGVLRDVTGDYATAFRLCMGLHALAAAVVIAGGRRPLASMTRSAGGRAISIRSEQDRTG